jgi:hypothetical protein
MATSSIPLLTAAHPNNLHHHNYQLQFITVHNPISKPPCPSTPAMASPSSLPSSTRAQPCSIQATETTSPPHPAPASSIISLCQQKNEREKEEIEEEIEKRKKGMKGEHGMN